MFTPKVNAFVSIPKEGELIMFSLYRRGNRYGFVKSREVYVKKCFFNCKNKVYYFSDATSQVNYNINLVSEWRYATEEEKLNFAIQKTNVCVR